MNFLCIPGTAAKKSGVLATPQSPGGHSAGVVHTQFVCPGTTEDYGELADAQTGGLGLFDIAGIACCTLSLLGRAALERSCKLQPQWLAGTGRICKPPGLASRDHPMIKRFDVGPRMSEMAVHNGVAYLAGQVADDATQDIGGQTRQVLAAIDALLARAGSDKSRILRAQIFLVDLAEFAAMNAVWESWVVPGHTPARATVQAALARPEWKLEIVVTAAA